MQNDYMHTPNNRSILEDSKEHPHLMHMCASKIKPVLAHSLGADTYRYALYLCYDS